ncbi:MAG: hypothetical protein AB1349_12380 [Elusimicrobiota bacterium]
MIKKILFICFYFLIGCATKPQIKTFYNCAFSPNLDYSKNYRTIVLPVTTEVVQNIDSNLINVLYNFTSLKLLRIGKFSLIERMKVEKLIKCQVQPKSIPLLQLKSIPPCH